MYVYYAKQECYIYIEYLLFWYVVGSPPGIENGVLGIALILLLGCVLFHFKIISVFRMIFVH